MNCLYPFLATGEKATCIELTREAGNASVKRGGHHSSIIELEKAENVTGPEGADILPQYENIRLLIHQKRKCRLPVSVTRA